jgi:hypothetical protein
MQATGHKARQTPQMTVALSHASAGLSVLILALGFALTDLWVGTVAVLAAGGLWLLGQWRGLGWTSSALLVLQTAAAAVATLSAVGDGWSVLGLVAALVAWDLDQFSQRMGTAGRVDDAAGLERRHIRCVLIVAGIGSLLGIVALSLQVRLSFGLALLLAVMMMLCLSLVIGFLRRQRD